MILQELYVFSSESNNLLKTYKFNEVGVNIILGEKREDDNETNGVGKSTMIDCISFLLGKTISDYYSHNSVLLNKNIFIALKIKTANGDTLYLGRSFIDIRNGYVLRGAKEASNDINDWKRIKLTDYKSLIEKLVLGDINENVTFAAIREYIIRDEKTGFNEILLPNRSALKQYILLNYLFTMLSNSELDIKDLRNKIDNLNNELKVIESMNVNISGLKVSEEELLNEIEELNKAIEQAKTVSHFNKSMNVYKEKKKQLNDVQNKIFENEHICNQYKRNIQNLHEKVKEIKQLEDLEQFYKDMVGFFPNNIKENYDRVKEFYDFMVENRGNYFKDKIAVLQSSIQDLIIKKQNLEKEIERTSEIFKSENYIDDISILMDEKRSREIKLAEVRLRINDYNRKNEIVKKINVIQHEILRINSMKFDEFLSYENKKIELQSIFNKLVDVAYKQHGYLDFEYNNKISYGKNSTTGRVKISCSIPDEKSHGRLHLKINMFDLTWFLYRAKKNLNIKFLFHDGSYSNPDPYVKGILLKYVNKKLKEISKGQYFVTLNKTEILTEDLRIFDSSNMIVAKLDKLNNDQNRFFGFKF